MQSLQVLFISRRCSSQYLSIANAQLPTLTTLRSQAYLRVSVEVPYAVLANSDHPQRHLLGNIARVVGRDASRASAQVGDLYVALSEDETIYGLFKTMKGNYLPVSGLISPKRVLIEVHTVQEQIERQGKTSRRPRRGKSFSRDQNPSPSRAISPQPPTSADKTRSLSTDGGLLSPRHAASPSTDKGRSLKTFKSSSDSQSGKEHQRTTSVMSDSTKRTLIAFQDQEAEVSF